MSRFAIDTDSCIGCGVSSSIAPDLIRLGPSGKAQLTRQPGSDDETKGVEAAALLCPVQAISKEPST